MIVIVFNVQVFAKKIFSKSFFSTIINNYKSNFPMDKSSVDILHAIDMEVFDLNLFTY
jgi:hypothetical protein